jgi:nitrogen PTS system EIIA component
MDLSDLIDVSAIMPALKANSKKQLLQLLAERAATISGIPEREVFDIILQRERLGSTGVGNGIAIPHGKLAGVKRIAGVFARLETPVDFESLDDQPVDLVFLLLAPEGAGADHLKALSRIARLLRDCATPTPLPKYAARATPTPSMRCFRRRRRRTRPDIREN